MIAADKRALCPSGYYYSNGYCYSNSAWYWWGRWVLAAVVILVVIGIFLLLGCVNARRRRRRGLTPMYGTGWMGGNKYNGPQGYQNQQYAPPPPQYSSAPVQGQYTGNTYNSNEGYYGQGIQPPQNSYYPQNRGVDNYEPPPGPPPSKGA